MEVILFYLLGILTGVILSNLLVMVIMFSQYRKNKNENKEN